MPQLSEPGVLCDSGLSPMKDDQREKNMTLSWVVAVKLCYYFLLYLQRRFKDGLATKDSPGHNLA